MALISESLNVLVTFLTFNVILHSGHEKTALLLGIASNVLFGEGGGGGGGGGGVGNVRLEIRDATIAATATATAAATATTKTSLTTTTTTHEHLGQTVLDTRLRLFGRRGVDSCELPLPLCAHWFVDSFIQWFVCSFARTYV